MLRVQPDVLITELDRVTPKVLAGYDKLRFIGDAGGDIIPCAPYQTFGTVELAEAAIEVCGSSDAVLLGNHGIVVCGGSIKNAFSLACNAEYIARLQYRAMCIGQPNILSKEQMDEVLEKFKSYGQPNSGKKGY